VFRRIAASLLSLALACGSEDPPPAPPAEKAWQTVLDGLPGALLRVWGRSSRDVYVVGADADGQGPLILHFDGDRWRRLRSGAQGDLWWMAEVGPDDIRMVGDQGLVLRYRPSSGAFEPRTTGVTSRLFGVWGAASDDVWYVGGDPAVNRGVVLHDDGATIAAPAVPLVATASATIFKVQGNSADDVWFVGQLGTAARWNGGAFEVFDTGTRLPLMGVHGLSSSRMFAAGGVGSGVLLSFDGAAWTDEGPIDLPQMIAVWAAGEDSIYAGGFNGRLYRRSAAEGWTQLADRIGTFQDLHSVWVDETGGIWAVGGRLAADPPLDGVLVYYGPPISKEVVE
jgi:hypothetical protein